MTYIEYVTHFQPFHSVKMRIKTDRKQFDIKDEAEDAQNGQTISNSGLDKDQEQEPEKVLNNYLSEINY